jgi:hypothetical protein
VHDVTTNDLTNRYPNHVRVKSIAVQMDIHQLAEVAQLQNRNQCQNYWWGGVGGGEVLLPWWRWLYECGDLWNKIQSCAKVTRHWRQDVHWTLLIQYLHLLTILNVRKCLPSTLTGFLSLSPLKLWQTRKRRNYRTSGLSTVTHGVKGLRHHSVCKCSTSSLREVYLMNT